MVRTERREKANIHDSQQILPSKLTMRSLLYRRSRRDTRRPRTENGLNSSKKFARQSAMSKHSFVYFDHSDFEYCMSFALMHLKSCMESQFRYRR